jgi:glycosyltransferase involved in cell wall biosynthesis
MMLLPIYRDHLVPDSEIGFLRRQYLGFTRMQPVWVGRKVTPAAAQLPGQVVQLGGQGLLGPLARVAFKALGRVPPLPAEWRPPLVRVVHAQFARGGVLALPLAQRLGVPLVVTLHGGDISKRTGHRALNLLSLRFPQLVAGTARFVCVSGHIAALAAARGVPEARLTVLPIGSELAETMPPPPVAPDFYLFVGRFVEKKGLPVLAEALRLLRAAGDQTRLVCVGDGPLRPLLEALAAECGGVELTGWLPPTEVRARMAGAWSLLVPSVTARDGDTEGLPSVIPEAMALGCPIIGSSHPAVAEGFVAGVSGVMVPEGDGAALAAAMLALSADPARRHALGLAAREFATQRLNAHRQSAALEELLLAVADG